MLDPLMLDWSGPARFAIRFVRGEGAAPLPMRALLGTSFRFGSVGGQTIGVLLALLMPPARVEVWARVLVLTDVPPCINCGGARMRVADGGTLGGEPRRCLCSTRIRLKVYYALVTHCQRWIITDK